MLRMSLDMVVLRLNEEGSSCCLRPVIARPLPTAGNCRRCASTRPGSGSGRGSPSPADRVGAGSLLQRAGLHPRQPGRDPRGWSTTLVYLCLVDSEVEAVHGCWHPLCDLPGLSLAFDHTQLIARGWSGCGSRAATAPCRCNCWGPSSPSPRCNGPSRSSCRRR